MDKKNKCTFGESYEKYWKVTIGNYNTYEKLSYPPVGLYDTSMDSIKKRIP